MDPQSSFGVACANGLRNDPALGLSFEYQD